MKKLSRLCAMAAAMLLAAVSCSQDLSDVNGRLEDLEGRVARLEKLCEEMNKNISSLQGIVTATETGDVITSVTPITEGGKTVGYTLTFAKGDPITLYHGQDGADGKDGKDGTNGKDGKDGADGHTPVIGVKQDTDGIWYWTIDGEWLLDTNGQKVKAVGTDGTDGKDGTNGTNGKDGQNGKDGVTPQLKIEDGYWYVSTDNGATWTQLGKATGEDGKDGKDGTDGKDGDSMFQSVTVTDTEVTFVTADGQTFVVKRAAALSIAFDTEDVVAMDFNATLDIHYTITAASDDVTIEALSSSDIKVKVVPADAKTGILQVKTANSIDEYSKVVVLVSCGTQTITRTLRIELETKTYAAPNLDDADVLANYDWYGPLTTKQKAFMLPLIRTSFINAQWYAWDNFIYVVACEIVDADDCENVGFGYGGSNAHATAGYNHIRSISPGSTVKCSGGKWSYVEAYLQSHEDNNYCISISSDYLGGDSADQMKEDPEYEVLKTILDNSNVVVSCASNNKTNWNNAPVSIILNEDCEQEDQGVYRSGSVNSGLNNKICVTGYNPDINNYFGWSGDSDSCRPIGFGKEKHNIVMPMFNLNYDTASSFSTAMFSGTLGNYLSILMRTHPGVTLEGANTILQENYLREETFKYVDDSDSSIKDGGLWYFFNTDKFFAYEVLQKDAVDAAVEKISGQAGNDASVALPGGYGICYTGPGVQFEVAGNRLDMTEENRAAFEAAWTADPSAVKWYFSPLQALIYGASGTSELTVGVLDTSAHLIPDVSRTVTVSLP